MRKQKLATGNLPQLLELQELTKTRQAIEQHLFAHPDSFVLHKGKKWTYDDFLEVLVKWCNLSKDCGVPSEDTRKFLRWDQKRLDQLGLTLN